MIINSCESQSIIWGLGDNFPELSCALCVSGSATPRNAARVQRVIGGGDNCVCVLISKDHSSSSSSKEDNIILAWPAG